MTIGLDGLRLAQYWKSGTALPQSTAWIGLFMVNEWSLTLGPKASC